MFMFSFRLRRVPVVLGGIALALVLALGFFGVKNAIWPASAQTDGSLLTPMSEKGKVSGKTNDDRLAFLAAYGWEVEVDPIEILEVIIPEKFDDVYEAYNDMQKQQGFDLSGEAGKRCKRYAYRVIGYPGTEEPVRVHVLVYKDKVIGGDVCSEVSGSFMHGFKLP